MLYGLVLTVHLIVCLVLIGVILLQGGRGGLSEIMGGAAAQSLFGGGAATVLTKATGYCAGIFVVTCLTLAYLSTGTGRSVIDQIPELPAPLAAPVVPAAPASESAAPAPAPTPAASSSTPGSAPSSP